MSHFVSASELSDLIAGATPVRLLDVRWRLDQPDGHGAYLDGHLPGAVYVDLSNELAEHRKPEDGRHPLPTTAGLQAAARRWGIRAGDVVVAYDDAKGISAARVWWLLRHAGVEVRVLDGGLRAWMAAGGRVESGEVEPVAGDITLDDIDSAGLSIDDAAAFPASGVLIDVRAPERYRGETEPLDPIAGHIPGAVNLPTVQHMAADGTLREPDAIRETFATMGITPGTPVAAYCGSGVTAAHTALVLAEVGIDAEVYPGSWSQWSNTPGRPVAIGAEPDGARAEAPPA